MRKAGFFFIVAGLLICPVVVFAEGVLEGHVLEIERQIPVEIPVEVPVEVEVPVNFSYPLETENYPDVPVPVGVLSAEADNALSLEQQRVVSTAFRRVYQEQLNAELTPGAPYDNKVRFAWGSDIESYMMYQHVGDGGDSSGEGLGLESLSILAMHPSGTQAFIVTNEFATLFYRGSGEENGVQAYGYPVSDAYLTAEGRAQAFSKGLMTVTAAGAAFQSDEIEFSSPGNVDVGAIPDRVGRVREDTIEKYDRYARAAMTDAFRREWEQARIRGTGVGAPANNDLVHEWAGRDAAPVAQNFTSDSAIEAWGIEGLAIIMMNPNDRRAFLIKDEFVVQYSSPRDDDYGGFGPDGYGYPIANEYRRLGYRAQPFSKGTMLLEEGEMLFVPLAEYE